MDDTHNKRRGSEQSIVSSAALGGIRPKKSSLVVSGSNSGNEGGFQTAEAAPTDSSSEPSQESCAPIDVDQIDVVEAVGMLFDEMDQIMTRMAEMLSKYISTDQFSNLLNESDEICYQAQEVCRVELDRRCRQRHQQLRQQQQQHQQQQQAPDWDAEAAVEVVQERKAAVEQQVSSVHHQPQPQTQKLAANKESSTSEKTNDLQQGQPNPSPAQQRSSQQPPSTNEAATTGTVATPAVGLETTGDVDDRQVRRKDSKDRIRHRRDRNHYKHQYRHQPQGRKPGDADSNGEMSSEEHQGAVYGYVSAGFFRFLGLSNVSYSMQY